MQLYDFHVVEVPEGLKQVRYSHKFFQRGRPDLLSNVQTFPR